MSLRDTFGTNVRNLRKARGLTQEQLAERVGVSLETIGKLERGASAPSFATVERIGHALAVSPESLFGQDATGVITGARGELIRRINILLARMNEEQLARATKMIEAFLGK